MIILFFNCFMPNKGEVFVEPKSFLLIPTWVKVSLKSQIHLGKKEILNIISIWGSMMTFWGSSLTVWWLGGWVLQHCLDMLCRLQLPWFYGLVIFTLMTHLCTSFWYNIDAMCLTNLTFNDIAIFTFLTNL